MPGRPPARESKVRPNVGGGAEFCRLCRFCLAGLPAGEAEGLRSRPGPREDHRRHGFHRRTHVPHEVVGVVVPPQTRPPAYLLLTFLRSAQEKLRRGRLGAGEGGQREVSAGGHLLLRGAAHLALVSHRGREKGGQKLEPEGGSRGVELRLGRGGGRGGGGGARRRATRPGLRVCPSIPL